MKKLLILLSILICFVMGGSVSAISLIGSGITSAGCDDCSGDLRWSWHMEDATDTTAGTPCGCADGSGDTSPTAVDSIVLSGTQKSDGTYSAYSADAGKYYAFTTSISDAFDFNEGKIVFDVYITVFVDNGQLFYVDYDGNNRLYARMDAVEGAIDFTLNWTGQSTNDNLTVNSNKVENQWLRVTIAWKVQAGNDFSMEVCDLTPPDTTANCVSTTENDGIVVWAAAADTMWIGNSFTPESAYYIDNIEIYSTSGL